MARETLPRNILPSPWVNPSVFIAGLMITTAAMIAELAKKEEPMGGGMGGMM